MGFIVVFGVEEPGYIIAQVKTQEARTSQGDEESVRRGWGWVLARCLLLADSMDHADSDPGGQPCQSPQASLVIPRVNRPGVKEVILLFACTPT